MKITVVKHPIDQSYYYREGEPKEFSYNRLVNDLRKNWKNWKRIRWDLLYTLLRNSKILNELSEMENGEKFKVACVIECERIDL